MSQQHDSISRNASYSLAGQLITAAVTAGLTLYLARVLGPHQFGLFSLALAVSGAVMLPSEFGVSQSAARLVAEHRDDRAAVAEVLASALRIKLYLATTVCIGLVLLAGQVANIFDEPDLAWPLRAMAVSVFGQNIMALYGGSFAALAKMSYSFRLTFIKSVVEAVATIGFVVMTAGAAEAAIGRAAGFFTGGIVALVLAHRLLGREAIGFGGLERRSTRRILAYASALFIIDGAFALFQQIDVLLIGGLVSAAAAGMFQAPLRLVSFLVYPAVALANGVAPRLASASGQYSRSEPFERAIRYTIIFQGVLVAPIVVWAEPLVDLTLGPGYSGSAEVLRALAPFVFLSGLGVLLSLGVNYLGEARRRVPIAIVALLVNLGIDIVLIPKIGIVAGAIGTDVAYAIYVPAHFVICKQMLDVPLMPIARTLARVGLAAVLMALPLLAIGTSDVSVVMLVVGTLAGTAVYLGVLFAIRELTAAEARMVWLRIPRSRRGS